MHTCHAHGCSKKTPPTMFMCRTHWFILRKPMRDAIWREYRPGQENDKRASLRYLAIQQRAISEVAFKPNDADAAYTAMQYLLKSEAFRHAAVEAGIGDPLAFIDRDAPNNPAKE